MCGEEKGLWEKRNDGGLEVEICSRERIDFILE